MTQAPSTPSLLAGAWGGRWESNLGPSGWEGQALTIRLWRLWGKTKKDRKGERGTEREPSRTWDLQVGRARP